MKKLLIHNNNTSFNRTEIFKIDEQFVFDVDFDKDVDFYIHDKISDGELRDKLLESDVVFIKLSLSQNYLEYLGIRLAYHIRLTKSLTAKACVPIVFIAEESFQFIAQTSRDPSILFTGGIYLIRESIDDFRKSFQWFYNGFIKPLEDFDHFIGTIQVTPPANYLSHHSIANEWSILRWSKALGIAVDGTLLENASNNIENLLYYKYLQAKIPMAPEPDRAGFKIGGTGKILLIDDEWNKGWDIVFERFFSISPDLGQHFTTLKADFKDKDEGEILDMCKKEISTIDPALIILDLRLVDADFDPRKSPAQLTGYKLLEEIKKFNPGIRVIIFSATNKVWNHQELQNAGADAFVHKESPEQIFEKDGTKETMRNLASAVQEQLRYKFQKDLFQKCREMKSYLISLDTDQNARFESFIKVIMNQVNVIISAIGLINLKKPITIDILFLTCYNLLELFKEYYLTFAKDYRYYLGVKEIALTRYEIANKLVQSKGEFVANGKFDSPSWFGVQAGLFIDYFKISAAPKYPEVILLKSISQNRNDYVHSTKKGFSISEVQSIFETMHLACMNLEE